MAISMGQFVNKYLGKKVADDGTDKGRKTYYTVKIDKKDVHCGYHQCGSLIKVYSREVFGVELGAFNDGDGYYDGGVMDGFRNPSTFSANEFEYFNNNIIPQPGDIVFFHRSPANYMYGHIGIVISANNNSMQVLEQNAGSGLGYGEGGDAITIRTKNYAQVAGYHRFRGGRLSRAQIAKIIFINMAGSEYYAGKDASNIWNGTNPNATITRSEVAHMMSNMFVRVLSRNISYYDLIVYGVWNGNRPNDIITDYELDLMLDRVRFI